MSLTIDMNTPEGVFLLDLLKTREDLRRYLKRYFRDQMSKIWGGKAGLTPQQAFTALGTSAVQFLTQAGQLRAFVNQNETQGDFLTGVPDGWTVVPNADGTVIVSQA